MERILRHRRVSLGRVITSLAINPDSILALRQEMGQPPGSPGSRDNRESSIEFGCEGRILATVFESLQRFRLTERIDRHAPHDPT
jgi:hypothetical protein